MECNNAIAYISFKITIQVVYLDRTGTRKTSPNYISTVWKGSTNVCHESSPPESNPQISKHTLHTKHTHRLKRDNPKFTWLLWLAQGPGFLNDMLNTPSKVHVASFGLATYRLKKKSYLNLLSFSQPNIHTRPVYNDGRPVYNDGRGTG